MSKGGFGRSAGFLNEIGKSRQERREPAQHVLGPSHVGAYAQQVQPHRQGPEVEKTPATSGRV